MILVVTSLAGGAGRSTISRSLAASLARGGRTVAWVGADLSAGPDGEGVDASLRTTAEGEPTAGTTAPVHRIGVADHDDYTWFRARPSTQGASGWAAILSRVAERWDVVIIDAPRLFDASEVLMQADHVLFLTPLDRPAPPSLDQLLQELDRCRQRNAKLRLDGIAITRVDASRRGAPRELEAVYALAPPRAFLSPLIPEGAGPSREGAIEELAAAWARRAGLQIGARAQASPREPDHATSKPRPARSVRSLERSA